MASKVDLVLKNAKLPDGRIADISITGGVVRHVGAPCPAVETIDCQQLLCLPAAVDMHVHMRGGRQLHKEDWKTGSMSAIAGGVTVVVDQPNTIPPITTPELLQARIGEAARDSVCSFAVNAGVTPDAMLEEMWQAGAMAFGEVFTAPSSYGSALTPADLENVLARIHRIGGLATIHAEEVESEESATLQGHCNARPPDGEVRAVKAVTAAAPQTSRLHFCHLSTAEAIRAAGGTVEVTPHHLFLSWEQFDDTDASVKVNPPLRRDAERRDLWLCWDRIDVIASDHAPHTLTEKSLCMREAPPGIPGVQTMVPLLVAQAYVGRVSLASIVEKTSTTPASILGIPRAGFEAGDRADFALYPERTSDISLDQLYSKCDWSPYEGRSAVFPVMVIMRGDLVYREGEFFEASPRWFPGDGYIPPQSIYYTADTAHL